ncbi:hypothetical protein OS493_040213 [Desmophyllum pertusum]|uniref:Uncharacterized protein n=1 Tax=Desmophyllum pertusum TaxID=174260 RepID=A0A9X0CZF5_9CNID|nr:hypothetical protein OS493_040213 [Desmophyllum pertusum]
MDQLPLICGSPLVRKDGEQIEFVTPDYVESYGIIFVGAFDRVPATVLDKQFPDVPHVLSESSSFPWNGESSRKLDEGNQCRDSGKFSNTRYDGPLCITPSPFYRYEIIDGVKRLK